VTLAMISAAALVLILAPGLSGPLGHSYEVLYNNVPFLKGFQDTHKFVALLPLVYAYLGGLGVKEAATQLQKRLVLKRKLQYLSILALLTATPLFYTFTMFNFYGQLEPVGYPEDWRQAERLLKNDAEDSNVLFLPWHLYMDYDWLPNRDKRLASPAKLFFSKPVISPLNIERESEALDSQNPAQIHLTNLLNNPADVSNFARELQLLGVKYVLLAKEADYQLYDFLYRDNDFQLIQDSQTLAVFQNLKPVAPVYMVAGTSPTSELKPVDYVKESAASYKVPSEPGTEVLFVPKNLDEFGWSVAGGSEISDPNSFFMVINSVSMELDISYRLFIVQVVSYVVSLLCLLTLVFIALAGFVKRRLGDRKLLLEGDAVHNR
jgi:hypothetical protein